MFFHTMCKSSSCLSNVRLGTIRTRNLVNNSACWWAGTGSLGRHKICLRILVLTISKVRMFKGSSTLQIASDGPFRVWESEGSKPFCFRWWSGTGTWEMTRVNESLGITIILNALDMWSSSIDLNDQMRVTQNTSTTYLYLYIYILFILH